MPWDDPRDRYRPGQYLQICDRSGFVVRSTESRKEWTGRTVRETQWEPRQMQDWVRAKPRRVVPLTRSPEPDDTFLTTNQVSADSL